MVTAEVKVVNRLGLHARPSAMLVTTASRFESEVWISKDTLRVNGKSIMGVMMLAAEKGAVLKLEVDGPDEDTALQELIKVIDSGFGEDID